MVASVALPLDELIAMPVVSIYEGVVGYAQLGRMGIIVGAVVVRGQRAAERASVLVTIIDGRVRRLLCLALDFRI